MFNNAGDIVTLNAKCKRCTVVNTKGGTENHNTRQTLRYEKYEVGPTLVAYTHGLGCRR